MTNGQLRIVDADGVETMAQLVQGEPYFRRAGVEHNVINDDDKPNAFIEVELK
ncbi:MAG: hypothetical protein J4F49_14010 [Rhodobacteraceae bacterium]|nr:hypothetical protein [Paracoccaceae bacterium]